MQTSELEKKNNKLTGDEECINFRPSPNFKHMKKYLKSKFEEANSPNQSSDRSTTPNSEEPESGKPQATSSSMAQRVQPPLPPNSPPPELVVPKQEVVDEEYNDKTATQSELKTEKEDVSVKASDKTMCRQFARGMCTRGATCIYVHELILSQLPGVYTFCKNFQNSNCNFPKCKFVHATVFEKEHFYRTGFLPPHTLAHLKESNSALGPPTVLEGAPAEASQVFSISNPPPAMHPGISALPTSGYAPPGDACPKTEMLGGCPPSSALVKLSSPTKREWSDLQLALVAHELDSSEPMLKKCKSCDVNELRARCSKSKMEKLTETKEKYSKQKKQLVKWTSSINVMFSALATLNASSPSFINNEMSIRNEKENLQTSMLDQILQISSRMNKVDVSQKIFLNQIIKMLNERSLDNCSLGVNINR